jgi:hypothetical protein
MIPVPPLAVVVRAAAYAVPITLVVVLMGLLMLLGTLLPRARREYVLDAVDYLDHSLAKLTRPGLEQ